MAAFYATSLRSSRGHNNKAQFRKSKSIRHIVIRGCSTEPPQNSIKSVERRGGVVRHPLPRWFQCASKVENHWYKYLRYWWFGLIQEYKEQIDCSFSLKWYCDSFVCSFICFLFLITGLWINGVVQTLRGCILWKGPRVHMLCCQ